MDFLKQAVQEYASGDKNNQNHQGQQHQQGNPYSEANANQGQGMPNQYNNQNAPQSYGNSGQEYNNQQGGQGGYGGSNFGGNGGQGGEAGSFFNKTGGEEFNRPHGGGGSGGFGGLPNIDQGSAMAAANANAGDQDSSLFSSAFGFLSNMNKDDKDDVDDDEVLRKHDEAYNKGNAGGMSANSIGSAAALQAMKMFTSGQSGNAEQSSGGNMQSKVIGMAMSEAAKLFDNSGGAASGNKQDAVNSAGMMMMKLLLKSQFSGTTGGANSGGLGSMMNMASTRIHLKFDALTSD
ncbi:uncharacterized protein MKK02DRAFT_45104 [Dioszegia hungarica]|uniref:DUF7721 domain-containing protein n=1 Tax=Dioszegia hungarica TaxID=4972 RepID=A0AA38HA06_9TREE|nr:uncharacterized protein MKK02DRAFT_45104 [Dioszegia hungarica]KAI9636396.1 hypothetical protein MKK02DRAFT_45104 [Dioszegia hungarica]